MPFIHLFAEALMIFLLIPIFFLKIKDFCHLS